ncbi:MAG: diaminopimelate epimerase [Lachnospiraceae bacterium]|nr:diaminopimelate epimerase [Lachnospiraceae bacterium]
MNQIRMKKYHGLGNDYLVLDPNKNDLKLQTRNIEMLCRRNFGVGADGLLYGPILEDGKIKVQIFNPDGSEAEKSGNGVRIFAKYLLDEGYVKEKKFVLNTLAGDVEIEFMEKDGSTMRVNMGKPVYAGAEMPLTGLQGEIVNAHLRFHDNDYNTTCLSVGNPNCVIMMEEVTPQKAKDLGPYVEGAEYFPNRTNMQICKVIDRENIAIEIYERGAGYTLASGTGACAAAAAAKRMGLVDDTVTVHMQGGDLLIEMEEDETIYMTGTVGTVGTFTLAENFFA